MAFMAPRFIPAVTRARVPVCLSSQVCSKLQMVYTEALRSLTHIAPLHAYLSLCGEITPVACFLHFSLAKIALDETQERLKCSGRS